MGHIAILYGGRSGEHEVSCTSAASVLESLDRKHSVILIGINRDGAWFRQDTPDPLPSVLSISTESSRRLAVLPGGGIIDTAGNSLEVDAALPVLHGSNGEDGTIQGLFEIARIPYAGAGVLGSALGMDKDLAKRVWRDAGLPVVPWKTLFAETADKAVTGPDAETLFKELGPVLFIKPANAGSSVGVSRVEKPEELEPALEKAFLHDRKVLVEQAVKGREIECSVMGYNTPLSFPPGEIIPAGGHGFYDYDAKYIDPDGALLKVPADLPEETAGKIRTIAERAYKSVGSGGLSRVDFLMEEVSGRIYINEINTMPGMTSISLFPRMAAAGGLDFTAMLQRLIDGAMTEFEFREGLSYSR